MLYFNRKEQNEHGTFKMMVQKVKNDEQSRRVAELVKLVPIEPDGTIVADPEMNFLVIQDMGETAAAISLSSDTFIWDIQDADVDEALKEKEMLGVFIVDVLEETPDFIFFELAVMLDKDLAEYTK